MIQSKLIKKKTLLTAKSLGSSWEAYLISYLETIGEDISIRRTTIEVAKLKSTFWLKICLS